MTDSAGDEQTTQRRHLSAGVKYILTAGAVATALAAMLGLGQALWPDPEKPAERLSARIGGLQVDPRVSLAEYLEDVPPAQRRPDRTASLPRAVFASASLAQRSSPTVGSSPAAGSSPSAGSSAPRRPEQARPTQTVAKPPAPTTTPQPPPTVTTPQPPPVVPRPPQEGSESAADTESSPAVAERVHRLLPQVEEKPLEDVLELPPGEIRTQYLTAILTDQEDAPPSEVRQMLTSTRLQIADTAGGPAKLSPLGVVVNFSAQIDGYRGKESVVRWSLFDARERTRMPQPWLRNRVALRLVPEAGSDRGSLAVWVPLPRQRGPYFVRLELLDDRGNRLDKADTESFDR